MEIQKVMRQKEKLERNSNIELLRILAIIGVIVLHYNGNAGQGFDHVSSGINEWILYILENIFICVVDLFFLISGYFLINTNKRSLWKPIKLITQVMIFNEMIYVCQTVAENMGEFSLKSALGVALPCNYFIILYCVIYIISPYLNIILHNLRPAEIKRFILIGFLLFSVYPTFVDMLSQILGHELPGLSSIGLGGSQSGYQIVNFALMYLIGAALQITKIQIGKNKLLFVWFLLVCLLLFWSMGSKTSSFVPGKTWEYCNPLIVVEAVVTFLIFRGLKIRNSRIINVLSGASLTVFLLHSYLLEKCDVAEFVKGEAFIMIGHIVVVSVGIYAICFCAYAIYHFIEKHLFGFLRRIFGDLEMETR